MRNQRESKSRRGLKKTGRPSFKATAAQRRQVRTAVKAGLPRREIAQLLGISQPTLRQHFERELQPPRPEFKATAAQRKKVSIAAGGGMSRRDIALALRMSVTQLRKHFAQELVAGALERRVEILNAMHAAGRKGNVSAQRAYLAAVLAVDPEAPRGVRAGARNRSDAPAKGKKAAAEEAANTAVPGTDWDELLPPSGATTH